MLETAMLDAPKARALVERSIRDSIQHDMTVRSDFVALSGAPGDSLAGMHQPKEIVKNAVRALEVTLFAGCLLEVCDELREIRGESFQVDIDDLLARLRRTCGVDLARLAREILADTPAPPPASELHISHEGTLRQARAVVDTCPVDLVERIARRQGLEAEAHRARVAFEGLRAYLRRSDPQVREQLRIAGRSYVDGRLELAEVAALLELDPSDAVSVLQDHGYARSADVIQLQPEDRDRRLAAIRDERVARAGRPLERPDLVARDVIASERIEGVDARPWIRRR